MHVSIVITYYGVLPVLVVLGVAGSVASMWVLLQPSLKKIAVNRSVRRSEGVCGHSSSFHSLVLSTENAPAWYNTGLIHNTD